MEPLFLWDEMINFLFLGPDDQLLHVRPKPTKAEANEAQRDRAQSSGGCRQIRPTVPNQSLFLRCANPTTNYQLILSRQYNPNFFQMHQSNEHQVVLKKVKIGSSGRYKCEVCRVLKNSALFETKNVVQVMSKKDSHYYSGPPFDAISQVGQMQVVGESSYIVG